MLDEHLYTFQSGGPSTGFAGVVKGLRALYEKDNRKVYYVSGKWILVSVHLLCGARVDLIHIVQALHNVHSQTRISAMLLPPLGSTLSLSNSTTISVAFKVC